VLLISSESYIRTNCYLYGESIIIVVLIHVFSRLCSSTVAAGGSGDVFLTEMYRKTRPALWSSGQSSCLQIHRFRVRFPALLDFLKGSESGTGSTP
jgi:hypothetical protein